MTPPIDPVADCPFCERIAAKDYALTSRGDVFSFEPLNPVTSGHRLFVPREHVEDATQSILLTGAVMEAAATYVRLKVRSANIITSIGADATQTVKHLHVHVVPRLPGDGLLLPWSSQSADPAPPIDPVEPAYHTTARDEGKTSIELDAEMVRRALSHAPHAIEALDRILAAVEVRGKAMVSLAAEIDRVRERLERECETWQEAMRIQARALTLEKQRGEALRAALEQIDKACSHDLLRLTGKAHSDMRPEDRTRSIQSIAREALRISQGEGESE